MTKTELAERAGISRGIITRMGKDEMVTLEAIVKICNALDCDISDVVSVMPTYSFSIPDEESRPAQGSNPS